MTEISGWSPEDASRLEQLTRHLIQARSGTEIESIPDQATIDLVAGALDGPGEARLVDIFTELAKRRLTS